jgi:hypothetical protein
VDSLRLVTTNGGLSDERGFRCNRDACPALWLAGGLQLSIVGVASFAVIGKLVGAGRFELPTPGPPERGDAFFQYFVVPCPPAKSLYIRPLVARTAERLGPSGLQIGLQI